MDKSKIEAICQKVSDSYKRVFGKSLEAVYLYGSYARGDFDEESDIDFAAIVKGERIVLQDKMKTVLKDTNNIDLEYDVVTSPMLIPLNEFNKYKDHSMYYKNILKEGKLLG